MHEKKEHEQSPVRGASTRRATAVTTSAQARMLEDQRTVGNLAVMQRMPMEDNEGHRVISGHGLFKENMLEDNPEKRRAKLTYFTVPDGVTIHTYAPDGASLENGVANRVEEGNPPGLDEVELVYGDSRKKKEPLPGGYPYRFGPGSQMVNYTIQPLDELSIQGTPQTYEANTSLMNAVNELAAQGYTDIHFACCSRGMSLKDEHRKAMPWYGWFVQEKTT